MKALRNIIAAAAAMATALAATAQPHAEQWKRMKAPLTMIVANDLGRNGYYDQKPIAETMGLVADAVGPECVVAAGDVHHFDGVESASDPLWLTNFELIYSHPELMIPWLPVLGNHEYRGNTQAVLDYTHVSRRWAMPARYYTRVFASGGVSLRIVFVDTTPLIDKYRADTLTYPDAAAQDADRQLAWLDSVLTAAGEDWVVVAGHHPIYAQTSKADSERADMQVRVDPILRRHKVDMYVCGHIHNFQHLRVPGSDIDYVVNSAGSLSRKVSTVEGTVFASPLPGFAVLAASRERLRMYLLDKDGAVLHTVERSR